MSDYRSDFVIITALVNPEFRELQRVVKKLGGRMIEENKTGIYRGELSNGEKTFYFYAASQVSPGMVSAATLATRMIEHYRPQYIVMLGIAAGFKGNRMPKGSVLIADFVADYQQGKMTNEGFKRNGTGTPLDAKLRGDLDRCKDDIMRDINEELDLDLKAYLGPIVSGSQVVASQTIMDGIKNAFRKVVGVEMEGYAIFQAAAEAKEPRPKPILIKSVSDYGDKSKNDRYQKLAARTSALFFMKFVLKALVPLGLSVANSGLKLIHWQHEEEREATRFLALFNDCNRGSTVKFIMVTGKNFLFPEITQSRRRHIFGEAIKRGVKFRGIVLDPDSKEAKYRSDFESPYIRPIRKRLLQRHAEDVQRKLRNNPVMLEKNLKLRYSEIGLGFSLWLFKNLAIVEPLHFGKTKEKRLLTESPLCGFSRIWIERSAPEFELLEDHFEKLWRKSKPVLPKG